MFLPPDGSEKYDLTIVTTPQVGGWQASFDGGTTWTMATTDLDPTHFTWLLKGPLCAGADPSAILVATDIQPKIRLASTPEIIVRKAPYVSLSTPDA